MAKIQVEIVTTLPNLSPEAIKTALLEWCRCSASFVVRPLTEYCECGGKPDVNSPPDKPICRRCDRPIKPKPEKYPMTYDQPAQIDCRIKDCKYQEKGGKCTNASPALTLNPSKSFVCWSKEDKPKPAEGIKELDPDDIRVNYPYDVMYLKINEIIRHMKEHPYAER